ncbi:hypothetical protein V1477_014782 [Vespula maculifrons]|uniref:Uncharacterized protein n=1 Tax=Vespula maculifrons TaxID=7453 RepID=A0ABD2BIF4_VESMC
MEKKNRFLAYEYSILYTYIHLNVYFISLLYILGNINQINMEQLEINKEEYEALLIFYRNIKIVEFIEIIVNIIITKYKFTYTFSCPFFMNSFNNLSYIL